MDAVRGSIRQRGSSSFELRVYWGTDPASGKRRWLTRTVRATDQRPCENSWLWLRTSTSRRRSGRTRRSLRSSTSGSLEVVNLMVFVASTGGTPVLFGDVVLPCGFLI